MKKRSKLLYSIPALYIKNLVFLKNLIILQIFAGSFSYASEDFCKPVDIANDVDQEDSKEVVCDDEYCFICREYKEQYEGEFKENPMIKTVLSGKKREFRQCWLSRAWHLRTDRISLPHSQNFHYYYHPIEIAVVRSDEKMVRHILKLIPRWRYLYKNA